MTSVAGNDQVYRLYGISPGFLLMNNINLYMQEAQLNPTWINLKKIHI